MKKEKVNYVQNIVNPIDKNCNKLVYKSEWYLDESLSYENIVKTIDDMVSNIDTENNHNISYINIVGDKFKLYRECLMNDGYDVKFDDVINYLIFTYPKKDNIYVCKRISDNENLVFIKSEYNIN
jgi:hypothetical protein